MTRIFISHAGRDQAWAEWARWHLAAAGYETELDSIDWPAGTNFMAAMHQALQRRNPMLVLMSTAYLDPARFTTDEWMARLAQRRMDPSATLIPLRIEDVPALRDGLWAPIIVPALYGLPPERSAAVLLDEVRKALAPPSAGALPPEPPPFPSASATAGSRPPEFRPPEFRPPGSRPPGPRPPGSLPPVWNLARRNPDFTGRDGMLNRLHKTLSTDSRAAVQALHGWGGVGKTQLALEYAHRFAGEYDLVWWVAAERSELIGDHLATLAVRLGLAPPGSAGPPAVEALRTHLRGRPRWLLIFDNAEDRDELAPWLPDGPGHLIITSRNPAWSGIAQPMDVDVFTHEESIDLLRARLPQLGESAASRLAEALGDLPLAIGQAADMLAETRASADAYLRELEQHAAEVLRNGPPPSGYPAPLAATVTLTAQRLAGDDPAAGQLLTLCAHLGPEPIPADLFTDRPYLLPLPLGITAERPLAFGQTVALLGRYGLARITDGGPLLHRLTQAVLRDADPDPVTHQGIVERLLIAAAPDEAASPEGWPRWTRLLPHILACQPATSDNTDLRWIANSAVWHLMARGDAAAALPLAEHLHAGWTSRLGPDEESRLAGIANTLAVVYHKLHRFEDSRQLNEDSLRRNRRLHGDDHPSTLISATHLAADLRMLGEYERARTLDEDTLARRRRVLGEEHFSTLNSASNLAVDLYHLGAHDQSRKLDEDIRATRLRVLGPDHPETMRSAQNLAANLRMLGEYERARELDEETLARRRRVLGENHPDTRESVDNLATDVDALAKRAKRWKWRFW